VGRLELTAAHATHTVKGDASLRTLGELVTAGRHDLEGLVARMHWHGWSERQVRRTVDLLLANGLLHEIPAE